MNITLNDEQMKAMLSEAMLRALDSGTREALIARALEYLVKPTSGYQGRTEPSPIEAAFRNAMITVAHEEARKALTEDARFQERVKALFAEAAEKAFAENRDAMVKKIADAIETGLTSRDRY